MPDLSPLAVAFLLFPNVTQLDLTGPAQVLSRLGNTKIHLVWKTTDPVDTDAGFQLLPNATFDQIQNADILCVPGGFGTIEAMQDPDVLDWVRLIAKDASWITSVCTGSLILAAAGLLRGRKSACHWGSIDQLAYFGAVPTRQRIVKDGKFMSGGGVTSGIDFAFALTEEIRGRKHAEFLQLALEYDPKPPMDTGSPEKAGPELVAFYNNFIASKIPDRDGQVKQIAESLGFNIE